MSEWFPENTHDALVSLTYLVGAALIAAFVRTVFVPLLRKLTARTQSDLDDRVLSALNRPVVYAILLAGLHVAVLQFREWSEGEVDTIEKISTAAAILVVMSAILRVFHVVANWYTEAAVARSPRPREIRSQAVVGQKVVSIAILVVGVLIVIRHFGVDIAPVVAGLGLGGLAVALALQDTLSNLFAGIYMMVDRPITVGDFIKLESGEEGFVEEIGWRNTKVRMWANNIVVIPNSKLSQSVVTNYYLPMQELSVYISCGVAYDSDLEHVERVAIEVGEEVMKQIEGSALDWTPVVRFKEFADFSINFVVVLRVKDFAAQYRLAHEYVKALHRRFGEEGIEIPFPIRTVIMRQPEPTSQQVSEVPATVARDVEVGEGEGLGNSGAGEA